MDMEWIDRTGVSALHHAAKEDVKIVRLLLADKDHQDFFDCSTALMIAASTGNFEIVRLLLNSGADNPEES